MIVWTETTNQAKAVKALVAYCLAVGDDVTIGDLAETIDKNLGDDVSALELYLTMAKYAIDNVKAKRGIK